MKRNLLTRGAAALALVAAAAPAAAQGTVSPMPTISEARAKSTMEAMQLPRTASPARVPMEAKIVTGAPYSADVVIESVQVLADGNRITNRTTGRVYRDSQGRTRREEDRAQGQVSMIAINDPVAQLSVSLDPQNKTAYKTPFVTANAIAQRVPMVATPDPAEMERKRAIEGEIQARAVGGGGRSGGGRGGSQGGGGMGGVIRRVPPPWDEKSEKLPARNIEGVMAEGTRVTRTIPAGAIGNEQPIVTVTEEWVSNDLQVLVLTRSSDPRVGEHTYRLLNIVRSEVAPSWFEVPADYTVRESGFGRFDYRR